MPRIKRTTEGGLVQHVMNRANRRADMFRRPADYQAFLELLRTAAVKFPVRLLAYCLMPNHWHLVVWPVETGAVAAYMRWLTGTHVRRYHTVYDLCGTGHLYQGRYTAVLVQSDVHLLVLLRYVEANPLRAGLVSRAEHWPWSSLGAHGQGRDGLVVEGPVQRPDGWVDLVNARQSDVTRIRRAIARGAPFGAPAWVRETAQRHGLEFTLRPRGRPRQAGTRDLPSDSIPTLGETPRTVGEVT